jgi:hypothetical protein
VREIAEQIAGLDAAASEDIGVHITKLTDALPSAEDVARVEARLTEVHGWPGDA